MTGDKDFLGIPSIQNLCPSEWPKSRQLREGSMEDLEEKLTAYTQQLEQVPCFLTSSRKNGVSSVIDPRNSHREPAQNASPSGR